MRATESFPTHPSQPSEGDSPEPGGLLDVLKVAAVVLDADGRITLWSPQAEELFGYTAHEALGRFAGRLLVHEQHLDLVVELFARVMAGGGAGLTCFPCGTRMAARGCWSSGTCALRTAGKASMP